MIPLFERYPRLSERLDYVPLAALPTPVERLTSLGRELGIDDLHVKRDDVSGVLYGGNKPRKLEFLLAQAVRAGARRVITFGAAGSNHALATAIYARELGLESVSMLMPQPNARYVRQNLLLGLRYGAELHLCGSELGRRDSMPRVFGAACLQMLGHGVRDGRFPTMIPPGGSSPLGTIGYVNAALELAGQVAQGRLPEPDFIYVAAGTLGTAAGLTLGLRTAKLRTRVVSVRVTGTEFASPEGLTGLAAQTNRLLRSLDASFPLFEFPPTDADMRHGYCGARYALFTPEGMAAVSLMRSHEGITLDGTYTGKTLAALIDDGRGGRLKGKCVVFWNTLNSRDLSGAAAGIDYHALPRPFHCYFEEPVQSLDRDG